MLQLSPAETIVFQRSSTNELTGNVHILNVSKKAVTYKVRLQPFTVSTFHSVVIRD